MATSATSDQLLVIIDPAARQGDGESVRIAKDVLSAGAAAKVCLPDSPEEFARVLGRRGSRRPVVVGDDRALVRAVSLLHRHRELSDCALSVVPVGPASLARSLGVPPGAVAAARAVLEGSVRRLDLLVDDSDGVVLGCLGIPPAAEPVGVLPGHPWLRSLVRRVVHGGAVRLRVDLDGETVTDLDHPVETVSISPLGHGLASVQIHPSPTLPTSAHTITVTGENFHYHADGVPSGPVRRRTWRVAEGAWGLVVPGGSRG
ncbi:diacylglycerol kinase family protein [Streptomyces sp. LaPpAH-108]|uniref:diacylglycerol kinase family protein n=1 Tax=Streptomyces sp. LaPpAH-108 TaxID=1155714 RepID=UPI00036FBCEC|nr:diacylglycerol kinase family protein [Streptomyces sp. LaPpAH-108]